MSFKLFQTNSLLIKSIADQMIGYLNIGNPCVLFPRPDFGGDILTFEPQIYFIFPTTPPEVNYNMSSTEFPIISSLNRNIAYAHYNLYTSPTEVSIEGLMVSVRDTIISKTVANILKDFNLSQNFLSMNSASVASQIANRIRNGVPFSFWTPVSGLIELCFLSNYKAKKNCNIDELEVSMSLREIQIIEGVDLGAI